MTKAELKAKIDADGGLKNQRCPAWEEAFKLHNATTGKHLKRGCGTCYRECYEWLSR